MQTDIWLTEEVSHPERCPLCSEPLKKGSTICFSCGFSTHPPTGSSVWIDPAIYGYPHSTSQQQSSRAIQQAVVKDSWLLSEPRRQPNPVTPIPPRASAQPANAAPGSIVMANQSGTHKNRAIFGKVTQQRRKNRGSPVPQGDILSYVDAQKDAAVWEYETSNSQTASSLPTLPLQITEAPTQPELKSQGVTTRRLPDIDEIETTPPPNRGESVESSRALVPFASQPGVHVSGWPGETSRNVLPSRENNSFSWTAGEGSQSRYARLISSRSKRKKSQATISFNPIDRVRWWLLRPRRIEFVLWLVGTILLVGVTCVLLLVTAFSFEWLTPGIVSTSSTNMTGNSSGSQQQATVGATGGMKVTLTDTGPLLPGQSIHLHGQGFSPRGHIRFLFDGTQPLLDLNGKTDSTQADARGIFTTTVRLNNNLPWQPGRHYIEAQDLATKHAASVVVFLAQGPIGKGSSSTPVPSSPPGITPTPVPGGQLTPTPAPVGQTPVPITPTPPPGTPIVTPTVGTTPTMTPTTGTMPTVTPTVKTTLGLTSATSPAAPGTTGLGYALGHSGDLFLGKQITHLSPWVWLMIACYSLSMVLLGLAGVLHKQRR